MQRYKSYSKQLLKKGGTGKTSYSEEIKEAINSIVNNCVTKEKKNFNVNNLNNDIHNLEIDLINRYNENGKNNNFSFPEIKPVFECIVNILLYFQNEYFNKNIISHKVCEWHIKHTLQLIQNASQITICSNIVNTSCPVDGAIPTNKDAKDADIQKYVNLHNKDYCTYNIYETPYNQNIYPYAYCIRVLVQAMNTIDSINIYFRSLKLGNEEWKSPYSSVYFKERYHFYLDYLLDNAPNVFILPLLQSIGASGLLWNRCSRIQLCGVVFDEIFVDEDIQSPSNFFWHDINHARRIYQNNLWYANKKKISMDDLHEKMKTTVKKLMPIRNWLNETNKNYESMIKILLFEVVHEDALPFVEDQIEEDLLFKSGKCYPYERTFNNDKSSRFNLRFYEQGASTLRTIYNKVRHEFFEQQESNEIIVKSELRYIKPMIESTYLLLKKVNTKSYEVNEEDTKEMLLGLIRDKKFSTHDSKQLSNLNDDPDDIISGGNKTSKVKNVHITKKSNKINISKSSNVSAKCSNKLRDQKQTRKLTKWKS
jgi:hypothetical protein